MDPLRDMKGLSVERRRGCGSWMGGDEVSGGIIKVNCLVNKRISKKCFYHQENL